MSKLWSRIPSPTALALAGSVLAACSADTDDGALGGGSGGAQRDGATTEPRSGGEAGTMGEAASTESGGLNAAGGAATTGGALEGDELSGAGGAAVTADASGAGGTPQAESTGGSTAGGPDDAESGGVGQGTGGSVASGGTEASGGTSTPSGGRGSGTGGRTGGSVGIGGTVGSGGMEIGAGGTYGTSGSGAGGTTSTGGINWGFGGFAFGTGGTSTTGGSGGAEGGSGDSLGGAPDSGGVSGSPSTGGSGQVAECRVSLEGATGDEEGGLIPVCCMPADSVRADIDEVLVLLNEHRAANGLSALARDAVLEEAIQGHCKHMSAHSFFEHEAPESPVASPWARADLCGTSANAENIAWGYRSAEEVMDGWKSSSGHNVNMLSSGSTRVGVGSYDTYWGQLFGP